jgi:hypothetical protein
MNNLEEIFRSWSIVFDHDAEQAELAAERIQICESCEFKVSTPIGPLFSIARCSVCGCALKAKIYTPKTYIDEGGSCPKELWKDVEDIWLNKDTDKLLELERLNEQKKSTE